MENFVVHTLVHQKVSHTISMPTIIIKYNLLGGSPILNLSIVLRQHKVTVCKLKKSSSYVPPFRGDWEPVTVILQVLSSVEKAEPVQVCFTLRLKDQWSMWMRDGCKVYKWIMFHGHLDYCQKSPLGGRLNTKTRRPWYSESLQSLIYSILSCVRTRMNRISSKWNSVEGLVTYDFTLHLRVQDHNTWFWRCLGVCAIWRRGISIETLMMRYLNRDSHDEVSCMLILQNQDSRILIGHT
jgi:hypothetical protein